MHPIMIVMVWYYFFQNIGHIDSELVNIPYGHPVFGCIYHRRYAIPLYLANRDDLISIRYSIHPVDMLSDQKR